VPCLAGFSTDILTGMIGDGYDPSVLNALFAANASDAQMQTLWDNYGMHQERGKETITHIVRMHAGHDLNHLGQVEKIRKSGRSKRAA